MPQNRLNNQLESVRMKHWSLVGSLLTRRANILIGIPQLIEKRKSGEHLLFRLEQKVANNLRSTSLSRVENIKLRNAMQLSTNTSRLNSTAWQGSTSRQSILIIVKIRKDLFAFPAHLHLLESEEKYSSDQLNQWPIKLDRSLSRLLMRRLIFPNYKMEKTLDFSTTGFRRASK